MFAGAIFSISIILMGLSAALNGKCALKGLVVTSSLSWFLGDVLNVIISADPPSALHGLICVDRRIVFTCKVTNHVAEGASVQYQWSIAFGDGKPMSVPRFGNTFPVFFSSLSTITVTCEVYVHVVSTQYGKDTVTITPTGKLLSVS